MSSYKHHTQQKKRKWAEQGLTLSPQTVATLNRIASDPNTPDSIQRLVKELQRFTSVQFTCAEVEVVKDTLAVIQTVHSKGGFAGNLSLAVSLLLELVFADHSRPQHRLVLNTLKKLSTPEQQGIVAKALRERISRDATSYLHSQGMGGDTAAETCTPELTTGSAPTQGPAPVQDGPAAAQSDTKVVLGQTLASLMWLPAFHDWVRPVVVPAVHAVALSTHSVLRATHARQHVAPSLMNEIQDAISSLYYLIQKHGEHMAGSQEGCDALVAASQAMIYALQGHVLVREAMASAAVVVWVASVCPSVPPQHTAAQFATGLFLTRTQLSEGTTIRPRPPAPSAHQAAAGTAADSSGSADLTYGPVEAALTAQGTSLAEQVSLFSPVGKICALKGLVTAIPVSAMCWPMEVVARGREQADTQGSAREADTTPPHPYTFLVAGALDYGCRQVLLAPDCHFKFHAACVTNACMSQVLELWRSHATSVAAGSVCAEEAEAPCPAPPALTPDTVASLMDMLWVNLDEPLAQTTRQLQGIFDMLLEVMALQDQCSKASSGGSGHSAGQDTDSSLLLDVARRLIALSPSRKARYSRLTSLVTHLGGVRLVELHPALIEESLMVMQEDLISNTASTFLKALLEALRHESTATGSSDAAAVSGPTPGALPRSWESWWMPQLMTALTSDNARLRYHVSVHALPVVLALEPSVLLTLIKHLVQPTDTQPGGVSWGVPQSTAALMSVLRAARQLQLVADLDSLTRCKKALGMDVEQVLMAAIVHESESVRADCLELVCNNPRTSDAPGILELKVVAKWLGTCLRSTSQGQRNRCISLLNKLMTRMQSAVHACQTRASAQSAGATGGRFAGALKGRTVPVVLGLVRDEEQAKDTSQGGGGAGASGAVDSSSGDDPMAEVRAADLQSLGVMERFCQWACRTQIGFLYPGAPFERKYLAIEMLNAMLAAFRPSQQPATNKPGPLPFSPFHPEFLTPQVIQLLLTNAIDSWDKLRQSATTALTRLPTPWPGLETPATLLPLLQWAQQLMTSPRLKEADAGARMLRLVFCKYALGLGWRITLGADIRVQLSEQQQPGAAGTGPAPAQFEATTTFVQALLDMTEAQCQVAATGEQGLLEACHTSFAHGPLLLLRYTTEEVPWSALAALSPAHANKLRALASRTLSLAERVVSLAVDPLSRPMAGVGAEDVDGGDLEDGGDAGDAGGDGEGWEGAGPDAQVVVTGCWLSVKEATLCVGTLAHFLPLDESTLDSGDPAAPALPMGRAVEASQAAVAAGAVGPGSSASLLGGQQLQRMGQLLVGDVLLVAKHNGTVDKAAMGLTTLTGKLLRSTSPALNKQPKTLLAQCMHYLVRPGQGLDDIVRRSAGLPLAIGAILRAEPANTPKVLLARTMAQVLTVAQHGAPALWTVPERVTGVQGVGLATETTDQTGLATDSDAEDEQEPAPAAEKLSEPQCPTADAAEPWPRVHAFNVLRHLISDSQLAVDTSGFHAASIQACISAVGDPAWQVRNAATLCFTALVVRVVGFKNVGKWECPRKALTGGEFFSRFPVLHAFLLAQLQQAVEQLEAEAAATRSSPSTLHPPQLHPSLFPILILLSRLRPGPPLEKKGASVSLALSPALFAPLVRRCAAARHYAVRQLAARSLAPLVPSEQVLYTLVDLLASLPASDSPAALTARQQLIAVLPPLDTEAAAVAATGADGQQQDSNVVQGQLMQLEALLRHNISPGCVDPVLQLVIPHLTTLMTTWQPHSNRRPAPAAFQLVLIRACHATLALMQPLHCTTHTAFLDAVSAHCQALISAHSHHATLQTAANSAAPQSQSTPQSATTPPVDVWDPMASSMLKEAAQLWVGLAAQCKACADPSVLVGGEGAQQGAGTGSVACRLSVCLQSGSVDARAGAAKAAADMMKTWRHRASSGSLLPPGQANPALVAASVTQAETDRWSHVLRNSADTEATAAAVQALAAVARAQVQQETEFKVRKRLLRVLQWTHALSQHANSAPKASLTVAAAGRAEDSTGRAGQTQSMSGAQTLLQSARGVEERAEALRWLGQQLCAHVSSSSSSGTEPASAEVVTALGAFCAELESSADPSEPDDVRLAASDALCSSGLVQWGTRVQQDPAASTGSVSAAVLRCWRVAITLSEDEDERVRDAGTKILQGIAPGLQQCHTETLQRAVVALLPQHFPQEPSLPLVLCDLLVRPRDRGLPELLTQLEQQQAQQQQQLPEPAAGKPGDGTCVTAPVGGSAMSGRIFDEELDNQHEEPLLLAQLAAQQLRQACQQPGQLQLLRRGCLEPVQAAVKELSKVQSLVSKVQQGSGAAEEALQVLQQPSVFPYIYSRLLLWWAVRPLVASGGSSDNGAWQEVGSAAQGVVQWVATLGSGPLGSIANALTGNGSEGSDGQPSAAGWHELGPLFLVDAGSCSQ